MVRLSPHPFWVAVDFVVNPFRIIWFQHKRMYWWQWRVIVTSIIGDSKRLLRPILLVSTIS